MDWKRRDIYNVNAHNILDILDISFLKDKHWVCNMELYRRDIFLCFQDDNVIISTLLKEMYMTPAYFMSN